VKTGAVNGGPSDWQLLCRSEPQIVSIPLEKIGQKVVQGNPTFSRTGFLAQTARGTHKFSMLTFAPFQVCPGHKIPENSQCRNF